MKRHSFHWTAALAVMGLIGSLPFLGGCSGSSSVPSNPAGATRIQKTNLVSDIPNVAAVTDPDLVNPWGIAFNPTGPFWIADNHSGKSTLYNGSGVKQTLIVNIPTPTATTGGAATGQVFNSTQDFTLANGNPALFIFSTEDGTIVGWNSGSGTNAEVKANRSVIPGAGTGAVYKGLAIGSNASGNFLYATDFSTGAIDVFDKNFALVQLPGSFADPNLPAGFGPFGIQNVGGDLYVTYARQDAQKHDDVSGPGVGLIDVFDTNGNLKRRFATGSASGGSVTGLNSPWGMALAPATFGAASNTLLVGNFGDGHISIFNISTGAFLGQLQDSTGANVLAIPGLWGLTFGNGGSAGSPNILYFTAGIGDAPNFVNNLENHGLFGSLQPVSP